MSPVRRLPGVARAALSVIAACLLSTAGPAVHAQATDYPNKPVRVLIGFPPGQATDTLGRTIAQKLAEAWGQQFVVDNKPGASGSIATQMAMQAPADGYTLLVSSSGVMAVNPWLYTKLPYDPVRDFVPVAGIAVVPLVLVVNSNFPAASVKELVAAAKAKPGEINYASSGIGITNHLVMAMFLSASGAQMTHVPYKGGPPALADIMGGQVQVMFETSVGALPFVKQGRMRALAVSSAERLAAVPDIPTVAEQGYPGFAGVPWISLMAPARTPPAIVAKLNAEVNRILQLPATRDSFAAQGVQPMVMSPDQLGSFIKSEVVKWGKAVKDSGAKAE
jgi:tripartite-type tricarboxylate transporter receptor subunit TctC